MYKIGDIIWVRGDEAAVISAPFMLNGGEFQTAVLENGKQVVVPTPAQVEKNTERARNDWSNMQDGFRRLRESGN